MDFDKLQKQVGALLAPARAQQTKADETKRMTAAEFADYAQGQIQKAKAEDAAGKSVLAKQRLTALQSEVQRLSKFEFKSSELPAVTVYKDPEQLETTEEERSISSFGNSEPTGENNWMSKANSLAKSLAEAIGELSNRPTDKNQGGDKKDGEEGGTQTPPKDPPAGDPPSKDQPERKEARSFAEADRSHEWPRDLAKSINPGPRDKDADYDWGRDGSAASSR